jgi:hypothetical protein
VKEKFARMAFVITRPLQTFVRFEPSVAHACVNRAQRSHLIPNFFGIRRTPFVAQPARDFKKNLDVVARAGRRFDGLPHTLHAALAVRYCPFGFTPRCRGRQNDVRKLGSLRQENILGDQEVETFKQVPRVILIRLRLQRILTDDVERPKIPSLHSFKHLREVPAFLRRDGHAPMFFKLLAKRGILDVLETGQAVRQRSHIAAALHVILST